MHRPLPVFVCAITLFATVAIAAVPPSITVQGRLTDNTGTPLPAGSKNFTFKIFDAPTFGAEIWPNGAGENQTLTSDAAGLWIGLLGASIPLTDAVFADTVRWLEVTVDGTTMPRIRLVTGPFAFRVGTVDGATGGKIVSKLAVGATNANDGLDAFVAGNSNSAGGDYSNVNGGNSNSAQGIMSAIAGGSFNNTVGGRSAIGGGSWNRATGDYSFVGGGYFNSAIGNYSVVAGGGGTAASDSNAALGEASSIGGGRANLATDLGSTIAGGRANRAENGGTVSGGTSNYASGSGGTIGGGFNNVTDFEEATVGGGFGNGATGPRAVVAGGHSNVASATAATVSGGGTNIADASASSIGGGENNRASGNYSSIAGGSYDTTSGSHSGVGGGHGNRASGNYSTVPGGLYNRAAGNHSLAAGYRANANHEGSFVWADFLDGVDFSSTSNGQFLVRASGGVGIGTNAPQQQLSVAAGLNVDQNNANAGDTANSLHFGLSSGEAIASKRTPGGNRWGLDFYTASAIRMSITNTTGYVGFGLTNPGYRIELPNTASTSGQGRANAWVTYSSRRWKDNIRTIEDALVKVAKLRGVEYDNKSNGTHSIGLIAEEVGQVIPEIVSYEENGIDAQSLDYARLTALLIEAVKEQQRTIEEQRQDIEALKRAIQP